MTDTRDHPRETDQESPAPSRVPRLTLRPIRKCRYLIPSFGYVRGCLWRLQYPPPCGRPTAYAVELEGLGYRRSCVIGHDPARAIEIFEMLVRNTVTPLGLGDVLDELTE